MTFMRSVFLLICRAPCPLTRSYTPPGITPTSRAMPFPGRARCVRPCERPGRVLAAGAAGRRCV